jgi:leucyl aminopeptidase
LDLDEKIIEKLQQITSKKENKNISFFLWNKNFETLFILYFNPKSGKNIDCFLWEEFRKLPSKFTILSNSKENVVFLLNNAILARYKYDEYKSKKRNDEIYFVVNKETKQIIKERLKTIENIILVRDLWNKPSNDLYPETFVKIIKKTKFKNVKVKVFDNKKVEKIWANLISSVWKWSTNKPYFLVLEKIVNKKLPTIWLVWKWITFDTGWIQVKPENHMYMMKWDMCWAGAVFAIMKELDEKKLNVNIIACLPIAENQIWKSAYKPSDIIKSYSWKTVNIIHTDAEWRLVLADGISYISKNYKVDRIISIATLTWCCMMALWYRYAWIMWTDEEFINKTLEYSKNHIEKYWRLPFDEYFVEKTKSEIADLDNLNRKVMADSTMWWAFLYNFLSNDEKFTHIDIAWTAINEYEPYGYVNVWMTGFWVDSLSKIIEEIA